MGADQVKFCVRTVHAAGGLWDVSGIAPGRNPRRILHKIK
jgi:hypothetical protein